MRAEWGVVGNVSSPRYRTECLHALQMQAGQASFTKATTLTEPKSQAPQPAPRYESEFAFLRRWQTEEVAAVSAPLALSAQG